MTIDFKTDIQDQRGIVPLKLTFQRQIDPIFFTELPSTSRKKIQRRSPGKPPSAKKCRVIQAVKQAVAVSFNQILCLTKSEFDTKLHSIGANKTPILRLNSFLEIFTFIPAEKGKKSFKEFYIEDLPNKDPDFYLTVVAQNENFYSNTLSLQETQFLQGSEESGFWFLKFFENNDSKPFLMIRVDNQGLLAEINTIKKGKFLTGNEIKTFCFQILDQLKIQQVILNDDSKLTLISKVAEKNISRTLMMRLYLPIVTLEGNTWYSKHSFSPLNCEKLVGFDNKTLISQNRDCYYTAVDMLRNFPILNFFELFQSDVKRIDDLCHLSAIYRKLEPNSNSEFTVFELGHFFYGKLTSLDPRWTPHKNTFTTEFMRFYSVFLDHDLFQANPNYYVLALATLVNHSVWIRSYEDPTLTDYTFTGFADQLSQRSLDSEKKFIEAVPYMFENGILIKI